MNESEFHRRAMELFDLVCDLHPNERDSVLKEQCAGNVDLRAKVDRMLAQDAVTGVVDVGDSGGAADQLAVELSSSPANVNGMPARIGSYRLVRRIGQGGMGIIYEAEQESPRRRVALKVLQAGAVNREMLRRFQQEAQVLGQLQHPSIAQVYEAGLADLPHGRQPFFAMEFIDGQPLDRHAESQQLSARQRLELMARVCDAVQHAHQKGIIHRDLKPANVLVIAQQTESHGKTGSALSIDAIGLPKVLDFGIARMTDVDVHTATLQTEVGQLIGTLAYMSPEQVRGDSAALDTRCDIYALGVMLYELLAGRRPHDLTGMSALEAAKQVQQTDPLRLGTIVTAHRGDVETIVAKAIEKDRERRYGSASELAADIRRHLHDQPIEARPASKLYQLRKFSKRNAGVVAGVLTAILALSVGLVFTTISARRAHQATLRAESESQRVKESKKDLELLSRFQQTMVARSDMQEMGKLILDKLYDLLDQGERDEMLRSALQDVNPASLARQVVDGSFLTPASRAAAEEFASRPIIEADFREALGQTYFRLGMHEQCLREIEAGLALRRKQQGYDHPDTIRNIGLVGWILSDMGRFTEAERYIREQLQLLRTTLPDDDELVLQARDRMVVVLIGFGRLNEAVQASEAVVADAARVCSPDDPFLMLYRQHLVKLYGRTHRDEEALAIIQAILDQSERTFGEDHDKTLICRSQLAGTLARLGRFDEAVPIYIAIQQKAENRYGATDPRAVGLLGTLAQVQADSGDTKGAIDSLNQKLDRERMFLPAGDPEIRRTINVIQRLESVAKK